jgi:hypothetical protein
MQCLTKNRCSFSGGELKTWNRYLGEMESATNRSRQVLPQFSIASEGANSSMRARTGHTPKSLALFNLIENFWNEEILHGDKPIGFSQESRHP